MSKNGEAKPAKYETLSKAALAIKTAEDFLIFTKALMSAVLANEIDAKVAQTVMSIADRIVTVSKLQLDFMRDSEEKPKFFEVKNVRALTE